MLAGNAAFSPASFESIATATGNGSSGTITFSGIPSTYQHLQVRLIARGTRANNIEQCYIRLNGDTGSNYAWHRLEGNGNGASASANSGSADTVFYFTLIPAANETANIMCGSVIDLLDYANTNKTKVFRSLSGYNDNSNSNDGIVYFGSGLWNNTNAVTSLSVISNGPFTTTTHMALYGIKGA